MRENSYSSNSVFLLFSILFVSSLFGGITGKISGKVLDAQSGKPLEGVNIVLLDHELGTITDKLGLFSIINVEPGQYSVQASMIGYAIIRMTHVDVIMNQTTVIKLFLKQKSIQLDEVLVEAKKLLVIHDVSSSRMDYSNKDITVLPVATISEAIGLQDRKSVV